MTKVAREEIRTALLDVLKNGEPNVMLGAAKLLLQMQAEDAAEERARLDAEFYRSGIRTGDKP